MGSAVLVNVPADLHGVTIAVTTDRDTLEVTDVLVRPIYSTQTWERLEAVGGSWEIRP